eukprot:4514350-Alexandrium_andersonii.AAC.1
MTVMMVAMAAVMVMRKRTATTMVTLMMRANNKADMRVLIIMATRVAPARLRGPCCGVRSTRPERAE